MFSPLTVPSGSLQLENGTLYQHFQHGTNYFDVPETQVRLGLLKRTEFYMFVPDFVLCVSLVVSVNVPTGSHSISNRGVEPVFRIPWGIPLSRGFSIMGMQSLLVLDSGRIVQYQPDFMLNKTFGKKARTNIFAEYVGFFSSNRLPPIQLAHFGLLQRLLPWGNLILAFLVEVFVAQINFFHALSKNVKPMVC